MRNMKGDPIAMRRVVGVLNTFILKFKNLKLWQLIKVSKLVDINTCIMFVLCTFLYLPERTMIQIPYAFKTFIR